MGKFMFSTIAAGLIGGIAALGTAPASATTLAPSAVATPGNAAPVETVQYYGGQRHGYGYGYGRPYHGGYGYGYGRPYYGGYGYSARPGFGFGVTLPGVTLGLGTGVPHAGTSSAHVQWCSQRYRTYDPSSDTYIPRVGERARCNSPYN